MESNQEIQSAIIKSGYDLTEWLKAFKASMMSAAIKFLVWILGELANQNIFAGHLNTGPNKVKCPSCGAEGSWKDT